MALAMVLTAIGLLHFISAFSPWPFRDAVTFTKTIGGSDDGVLPPAPSTLLVGLALVGGAVLTSWSTSPFRESARPGCDWWACTP
ncbi:hypothetical protein [Streptomyces platensis]|uniref:hypothetical protein n=1 Tax=Streptomyces platensis TaxID=58346 RepID=UPI00331EABA6